MVFGHVGRRHKDAGLAEQFEFADGACACPRHHKVGCCVCRGHVGDERCHHNSPLSFCRAWSAVTEVLACLPDELKSGIEYFFQSPLEALIDGKRAEASADNEQCRFVGIQSETLDGGVAVAAFVGETCPHRVAGLHDFVGWEKSLHTVVGHADSVGFLRKQFVGDSGIRILFLDECGDTGPLRGLERRPGAVASHPYGYVGLEILYYGAGHRQAFAELEKNPCIAPYTSAVKSCHRKAFYLVARRRHPFHLHPVLGSHKENLRFKAALKCSGYREGRKDVSSGSPSAYQYSVFSFFHCCLADDRSDVTDRAIVGLLNSWRPACRRAARSFRR